MTMSDLITRHGRGVGGLLHLAVCMLLFAVCGSPLSAAEPYHPVTPDPVLQKWRWRSYPQLHGTGLFCVAQAADGAMWFGLDGGAMRYDGVNWTPYAPEDGLMGAPVKALCATEDGSLYAGTDLGISRLSEGAWRSVFPPEGDLPWPVNAIIEASDGSVWAGTSWGALHLGETGATLFTTPAVEAALGSLALPADVRCTGHSHSSTTVGEGRYKALGEPDHQARSRRTWGRGRTEGWRSNYLSGRADGRQAEPSRPRGRWQLSCTDR